MNTLQNSALNTDLRSEYQANQALGVSTGINEKQVKWAKQHDWFQGVEYTASGAVVHAKSESLNKDGSVQVERAKFTSFKDMYRWAGY